MTTKQAIITIVSIVLGFIVATGFAHIFSLAFEQVKENKTQTVQQEIKPEPTPLAQEARVTFIASCNEDGGMYTFCACAYDYLYENYGLAAIMDMGLEYDRTGLLTPEADEAIAYCIN